MWILVTPWTAENQASLSFTISCSLLKLVSTDSEMPCNYHALCHLTSPPAFNLSQHHGRWVSSSQQVAKVLELQLQHQSFQWIFRNDFLSDWQVWLLCSPRDSQEFSNTTVQSIVQCSAFFMVRFSHPYMTTGKNIALTRQTFVGKVMSLLFNVLPRRQWHPTPVLLPGKSHGWRSLVGCSPWGR